jgi:hypothetical protein
MQRSFRGFLERYHPQTAYIVNRSFSDKETVGTTEVRWLPWWDIMDDDFAGYR